jgi:hypothetical protein
MKTDQLMKVSFQKGDLLIFHKSRLGNLNQLFDIGNAIRINEGKPQLPLTAWIQRQDVKEYIKYLKEKEGKDVIIRKKGKNGGTYAHLFLLLDAAMALSPILKYEVHKTFIEHKILHLRDLSGDNYIELNAMIALKGEEVLGKPAHNGHYINIAKKIKKRLGVENWNVATSAQLAERTRIEEGLVTLLKAGVVKDWDHLKELVDRI